MQEGVYCFILCFGVLSQESASPQAVDTLCSTYSRIAVDNSDVSEVMKLPRKMRDRIQGNDLEYLCRCKGWAGKPEKKALCDTKVR